MKRTKFLALVLVAAIALMGAGYAWWTDTLVVDSTVNTGYLDVDFTSYSHEPSSEWVKVADHHIKALADDGEDYPNGSRDNVVLTINDMYPGSYVEQTVTLTNVGTMPVNLSQIDINSDADDDILGKMHITVNDFESTDFENGVASVELDSFWWGHNHWYWEECTSSCPKYDGGTDPDSDPDPDSKYYLEPGEKTDFVIRYELDETADDDITENKDLTFQLTIEATQYNYQEAQ